MRRKTRRIVSALLLLSLFPLSALAATWTFNTWAKSPGGSITSRNMVNQTSTAGSVYRNYTTHAPLGVTVTASTGYNIYNVTVNGVPISNPASPFTASVQGMTAQSVLASFSLQRYQVTATAGQGGSVTPASASVYYGMNPTSPIRFTFVPASGYQVTGISGVPVGATSSTALPAPTNTAVTVTFPTTFTFTGNIALAATFAGPPIAVAGAPQVALPNTAVTLDGTASQGAPTTWLWSQTGGPGFPGYKVMTDNTSGSMVTFTPAAVGTYYFLLTVNGGSTASTYVMVTDDPAATARSQCQNCHDSNNIGTGKDVFDRWSTSLHRAKIVMCATCHTGANAGGHPGSLTSGRVDEQTFNFTGTTGNFCITCHNPAIVEEFAGSGHFIRAGSASCSFCHTQGVHNPNTACVNCHAPVNDYGLAWPPSGLEFHSDYTGSNLCSLCHNTHSGVATGGACGSCHDSPPATASHLKHYASADVGAQYGDLRTAQAFTNFTSGYVFGCGNCHPLDPAKHRNGKVDIELYNPQADAGSIKAMNPESAAYVPGPQVFSDSKGHPFTYGTCSNVYCHSVNHSTTTQAIPESDPSWESKVLTTREYKTVTWGSGPLTCSGCHGNPTQSSYPTNDAGAGDSHSWIDPYGYQNLHTYNMGYAPISCSYCHNDTVKQQNSYTEDGLGVRTLGDVPISNYGKHVNGSKDVAFDKQHPFVYPTSSGNVPMSLGSAIYDKNARTCSNVACHIVQTTVKWGTPYRWYTNECSPCHGYN